MLRARNLRGNSKRTRRQIGRSLQLESLESRLALATVTWTGGGDGQSWGDASNWDRDGSSQVPQNGDDVVIPNLGDPQVNGDINVQFNTSVALNSLISAEALTIVGGSLALANASQIDGGLKLVGGSLSGNGVLTLHGISEWSGGSLLTPAGKTVVASSGTLNVSGTGNKYLSRLLESSGTINYDGSGLQFGAAFAEAGVITNGVGGVFNAIGDGDFVQFGQSSHAFNNQGTFNRSGAGNTTFTGVEFNNSGSINVQAELLQAGSGGTFSGSGTIVAGTVQLTGGTTTFENNAAIDGTGILQVAGGILNIPTDTSASISNLHVTSGSVSGAGVLTLSGDSEWSGGSVRTPAGKTVVASGATLHVTTGDNKYLSRLLESSGTINYDGSGLQFGAAFAETGVINNSVGGVFNAIGDGDFVQFGQSSHAFNNEGAFNRSGAGNTTFTGVEFNNSGSINVQAGLVQAGSGGTFSGASTIVAGTVQLTGGTTTFENNAAIDGTGILQVAGGILNIPTDTSASISNLYVTSGSVSGAGVLTLSGDSEWSGGSMRTPAGKTVVASGATLHVTTGDNKYLSRLLESSGTINYDASGLQFGAAFAETGVINNSVGGVFNAIGDGDFVQFGQSSHAFNNEGAFNRSGAGNTTFTGVEFNNSGSINVQAGLVQAGSGGTFSGASTIVAGAVQLTGGTTTISNTASINGAGILQVAGATLNIPTDTSASISNLFVTSGSVSGAGVLTLSGNSEWSGGSLLTPAGKTVVESGGTLNISSGASKFLSRILESSGTINYDGSGLQFGANFAETGVINNSVEGVFNAIGDGDFAQFGQSSHAFNNEGLFVRRGIGTSAVSGVSFNNSGSIQIDEGSLQSTPGSVVTLNDDRFLASSRNTVMNLAGGIVGNTTNRQSYYPLGLTRVTGGTNAAPSLLEAMSEDRGASSSGYSENFSYGRLQLTSGFYSLIDHADNYPNAAPEAMYVEMLDLPFGASLNLNGIKLYVGSSSQIFGSISGGSPTIVFPATIPVPAVSIVSAGQNVNENSGVVNVGVNLNSPQTRRVTVPLVIGTNSTAFAVSDFNLVHTEVTFEPGQTSTFVQVEIVDDSDAESQEQIIVQLRNTAGMDVGPLTTHVLSINDNDTPPGVSFTATTRNAVEGEVITIEVQMDAASNLDVTVPIRVTALSNPSNNWETDLTLPNRSIIIPAGFRRASISLTVTDDTIAEKTESFRLRFGTIENATPSTAFRAALEQIVTVAANDLPTVAFEIVSKNSRENDGVVPIKITMTPAASYPVTVNFVRQGSANGADVILTPSNFVTFAPGFTSAFINATLQDDSALEDIESLVLTLQPQFTEGNVFRLEPGKSQHRMYVIDNEARLAEFTVETQEVWEDFVTPFGQVVLTNINATVALPFARSLPTTFRVKVTGDTASKGLALRNQTNRTLNDFGFLNFGVGPQVAAGLPVTIPAGQMSVTIPIQIFYDPGNESREKIVLTLDDTEFTTNFGAPSNLGGRKKHTIYIKDNDPIITIKPVDSNIAEGNNTNPAFASPFTPLSLSVELSAPSNRLVSVPHTFYKTQNGRTVMGGTATVGSPTTTQGDFFVFPEINTGIPPLSLSPGQKSKTVSIAYVKADRIDEPNETIVARFGTPVGGGILANSSSTFTIVDDDSPPTVSFKTANGFGIYEGKSATFEVQLTGNTTQLESSVKVNFSATTAKRNTDYSVSGLSSGDRLVFSPGERKKSFTITARNDSIGEPEESFQISLSDAQNVSLSKPDLRIRRSVICDVASPTFPSPDSLAINVQVSSCATPQGGSGGIGQIPPPTTVSNGPISGSTTFFDSNFNGIQDFLDLNDNRRHDIGEPSEPTATTDQAGFLQIPLDESFDRDGNGELTGNEGRWTALGGVDVTTGLPWRLPLFAPIGVSSITPITNLVESMVRLHGLSAQEASERTLAAMGAEGGSLSLGNIRDLILAGDQQSAELYTELIKLSNSAISIADLFHGAAPDLSFEFFAEQVFATLAGRIVEPDSLLELDDRFTWEDVIENVARQTGFDLHADPVVHSEIVAGASQILSESNQALRDVPVTLDRQFVEELTKVKKVVQGDISESLRQVGQGTITIQSAVAAHTGTNLHSQISAAVIGNVFPPLVQVADTQIVEGNSGTSLLQFTVELIGEHQETVTVNYSSGDMSATVSDGDYVPVAGSLTWLAGDNTPRTVQVTVNGDSNFEFDEQIALALSDPTNAAFGRQLAIGSILSEDSMIVTLPEVTGTNLVTVQSDGQAFHMLVNDEIVHTGLTNTLMNVELIGRDQISDQFEFLMQGDLTRNDRFKLLGGGGGSSLDAVQWQHGNFAEIVHRVERDGRGQTIFNTSGEQSAPLHQQFDWAGIEEFQLAFGDTDRLVIELESGITAVRIEDADPTDLVPGLAGMMRLFSPTGQFTPVLFNPSMGELLVRGYFEASAFSLGSPDPAFVITPRFEMKGDFDGSGQLDVLDVDALTEAIAGRANPPSYDLTGDGHVNLQDLTRWLELGGNANLASRAPYLMGDANLDGAVDGTDLSAWDNSKFTAIAAWSRGDFNADGAVDGTDFNLWSQNKFNTSNVSAHAKQPRLTPRAPEKLIALADNVEVSVIDSNDDMSHQSRDVVFAQFSNAREMVRFASHRPRSDSSRLQGVAARRTGVTTIPLRSPNGDDDSLFLVLDPRLE